VIIVINKVDQADYNTFKTSLENSIKADEEYMKNCGIKINNVHAWVKQ
jgi:hypothetical protein